MGGGIAWVLLAFVGQVVGNVLLVGFIIALGVVIRVSLASLWSRASRLSDEAQVRIIAIAKEEGAPVKEEAPLSSNAHNPQGQGGRGSNTKLLSLLMRQVSGRPR